ncbi:hypothetical protein COY27_03495 [Candidatus Woesearchaeota archaeon CG_4_10_14_0_2_um_filter_33_13]|nr:MAG: hypothetical protein COY27_03495 [Candidatus Woesearchaeota archaeon CG_4_10_14_0_2_um_filter_33_13]
MQKEVLNNGLTVLYQHKPGNSVVIEVMVASGSNNEAKNEKGISHFIEHMLFEGTEKRPTNLLISNEIEKIGGEFNAYTTNERTCYYIKVLKKHFLTAVDVLSDIILNPSFKDKDLKREKGIVLKEIDLVNDEPRFYQWDLLQKNMFVNHPAKNPVYGDKKVIKNLSREQVLEYFNRHYVAKNMVLSIVGDIKEWKKEIRKKFAKLPSGKTLPIKVIEPESRTNKSCKIKKKIVNTYLILGFKTVPRTHPHSYVLEVINSILGRGQSGRMFTEIRAKKGLAYDVGTQNINEITFGYFAAYATIEKSKIDQVKRLIFQEIEKLKDLQEQDLKEAKDYLEGSYLLDLEDGQKVADQILFWEQAKQANEIRTYLQRIKLVTINDIKTVINKYFQHHVFVLVEGK